MLFALRTFLELNLLQVLFRWGKIMKKYVAYYNRKTRKLEKIYIKNTYYWCDFFSFVSPSGDFTGHTYAFDCKNIKCRIGGSYLQEKSLPLLYLETLWSCHGEIGKWKFERTVTLMGRWPKTNVYHIERGIYRVDHLKRNCIGTI